MVSAIVSQVESTCPSIFGVHVPWRRDIFNNAKKCIIESTQCHYKFYRLFYDFRYGGVNTIGNGAASFSIDDLWQPYLRLTNASHNRNDGVEALVAGRWIQRSM
jgi:hypothetical protein